MFEIIEMAMMQTTQGQKNTILQFKLNYFNPISLFSSLVQLKNGMKGNICGHWQSWNLVVYNIYSNALFFKAHVDNACLNPACNIS